MFFHPKNLKSENNNPWFKPWINILLHTQATVCATVDIQCLKYLEYNFGVPCKFSLEDQTSSKKQDLGGPVHYTGWVNLDKTKYWVLNFEFLHTDEIAYLKCIFNLIASSKKLSKIPWFSINFFMLHHLVIDFRTEVPYTRT